MERDRVSGMKCKRCGSEKSQINGTEKYDTHNRRPRRCLVCGNLENSIEVWESDMGAPGTIDRCVREWFAGRPEVDA